LALETIIPSGNDKSTTSLDICYRKSPFQAPSRDYNIIPRLNYDDWHIKIPQQHAKNARRRRSRLYQRSMSGIEIAYQLGEPIRFLTLTTAPESTRPIKKSFAILVKRLRRKFGTFEYLFVNEKPDEPRSHLHILFRGSFMHQAWLSQAWCVIANAPIVDIRLVRGSKRQIAGYLLKYMDKESTSRIGMSAGWVFKGFVGFWKEVVKDYGQQAVNTWTYFLQGKITLYFKRIVFDKGKPKLVCLHQLSLNSLMN